MLQALLESFEVISSPIKKGAHEWKGEATMERWMGELEKVCKSSSRGIISRLRG